MPLKPADWHKRFTRQAVWTSSSRQFLFNMAGLSGGSLILDLGCGTGALAEEILKTTSRAPVGLDINTEFLALAAEHIPGGDFVTADAHDLPFNRAVFDASLCHYVLMWVAEPLHVLQEMARVTKPGSVVLALAEPDYGGRIDFPTELESIQEVQTAGLEQLGADPELGRKVKGLFHQAGLVEITAGIIGAQWSSAPPQEEIISEWEVIEHDLESLQEEISGLQIDPEIVKKIDEDAWKSGERVLYVPTFYAFGRVPRD